MSKKVEWPTIGLLALTYAVCGAATLLLWDVSPILAVALTAVAIAQHSSLPALPGTL